ncbi:MAG: AraC family transcriptional regulator [Lachnospiraceae bacterium]|nr:AraC family transcriptional regulator [Lachnospiraceae bacterium]
MKSLYENTDRLNSPLEAWFTDTSYMTFPIESHWHYFVEILYVTEGIINVSCNETTYTLKKGEMIFIPPQVVHAIFGPENKKSGNYVVLRFDPNRMDFSMSYLPKVNTISKVFTQNKNMKLVFSNEDIDGIELKSFFDICLSEMDTKKYGYDQFMQYHVSALIIALYRYWHESGVEMEQTVSEDYFNIHDILMYIDRHSNEQIRMETLAKKCNMSYSYFAKVFHDLYGQSCKEYIEFIRLSKVENLLLFTDYDLNYISSETGFSDCSHLIRVFKRRYGITPKKYRAGARS